MRGVALESRGRGRPLVLIHGLATTRVIWRRALPLLRPGRRVVLLDVPGFGCSPAAGPGFDLGAVAARIADALARAHAGPPYDLVGHSMGGAVALALAARAPQDAGRVVLVAPAGFAPVGATPARLFGALAPHAIALRRAAAPLARTGPGRRLLMTPGTVDAAALPAAEVRALLAASRGATRTAQALATVAAADLRPVLAGLTAPVGVIWGDRDRIVPPGGIDTVLALRPGAPVATIARTGHIPMVERPAAFARALDEVLRAASPARNTWSAGAA